MMKYCEPGSDTYWESVSSQVEGEASRHILNCIYNWRLEQREVNLTMFQIITAQELDYACFVEVTVTIPSFLDLGPVQES